MKGSNRAIWCIGLTLDVMGGWSFICWMTANNMHILDYIFVWDITLDVSQRVTELSSTMSTSIYLLYMLNQRDHWTETMKRNYWMKVMSRETWTRCWTRHWLWHWVSMSEGHQFSQWESTWHVGLECAYEEAYANSPLDIRQDWVDSQMWTIKHQMRRLTKSSF